LNPALVSEIVKLAHGRGLRVAAHVYTATDFHNALIGGVDDIGHLHGTGFDSLLGYQAFRISAPDAQLAARRHVSVTTTISWLDDYEGVARQRLVDSVVKPNLELLRANGVPILLGSDEFRGTSLHEAKVLASLGLFPNRELLDIWSRVTPQAIFPQRKIGRLANGYEASLLVLSRDPIADFSAGESIPMRLKQGYVLQAPRKTSFPALGQ
jgi:imidazolonepropionase-like amidohydrolase